MSNRDLSLCIRTFLSIENRLFRESFARLLRKRSELELLGQFASADEIPQEELETKCDVLLGDSFMLGRLRSPGSFYGEGGLPARVKVILIGMSADEEHFLAAVRYGVSGYLLQDASASDAVGAIRSVFKGEAVCPPQLCAKLFQLVARTQLTTEMATQNTMARPDLTLRQQQLMSLVAKGLTNKEIASRLNLSTFTVRNHLHRILKQVDAESRSKAVETIRAHGYSIPA
jgi:DNA-binding NarL/FixJ family response regulator